MTDRELLEMAAKAAGMDGTCANYQGRLVFLEDGKPASVEWNPLTDDGDALRLAVKLRIDLSLWINAARVTAKTHIGNNGISLTDNDTSKPENFHGELFGDDPCAATRRAIVRAAAEIGKSMP